MVPNRLIVERLGSTQSSPRLAPKAVDSYPLPTITQVMTAVRWFGGRRG
jgi:hypothetical protein